MKKPSRILFTLFLLVGVFIVLLLADTLVVKIKTTHIRKDPQFYAQSLAVLRAGDSVETISTQDGWIKVRTAAGVIGWIHSSSVEQKKFRLSALDKSLKTQASAGEVALAGKGFNKQVEESFREKNPNLSFVTVDAMLLLVLTPEKIAGFLKDGKLGEFRRKK
jgi:hypothetical protein